MNVAALFSSGKDSVFAVYIIKQYGWKISNLVTILPQNPESWMFHSINIRLTSQLAEALNIPHIMKSTKGKKEQELIDLKNVLLDLEVDGIISGAIASEYQRTRIEKICDELGMKSFTPLWHKNQESLLREQVKAGFNIIITGVFAQGFDETWLGRSIDERTVDDLIRLNKKHRISIAGEGGEFETLVLDGPGFTKTLVIDESVKEWNRDSGVLRITKIHLDGY